MLFRWCCNVANGFATCFGYRKFENFIGPLNFPLMAVDMFDRVLELATGGARAIYDILKEAIRDHASDLLS